MKNVLIVMLALVVIATSFGIAVRDDGLSYEGTLANVLNAVSGFTEVGKEIISFTLKGFSYAFGTGITKYDDYDHFDLYRWEDPEGYQYYLVIGQRNIFPWSEEILYCTYDHSVTKYDYGFSWVFFGSVMRLYNSKDEVIVSISASSLLQTYLGNAYSLSLHMQTIPELSEYREIFEAGR